LLQILRKKKNKNRESYAGGIIYFIHTVKIP